MGPHQKALPHGPAIYRLKKIATDIDSIGNRFSFSRAGASILTSDCLSEEGALVKIYAALCFRTGDQDGTAHLPVMEMIEHNDAEIHCVSDT
jgi:hypothetical protein